MVARKRIVFRTLARHCQWKASDEAGAVWRGACSHMALITSWIEFNDIRYKCAYVLACNN